VLKEGISLIILSFSFFFFSLYCWRTRRLLADRHLPLFKYMQDGNLGRGLRKLKNLPEPEPPVVVEVVATPVVATTTIEGGGEEEMKEDQQKETEEDKEGDNEAKEMEIAADSIADGTNSSTTAAAAAPSVRAVDEEPEEGEEVEESSESNKMET
jgi:Zn-dependent protease with chaperone function